MIRRLQKVVHVAEKMTPRHLRCMACRIPRINGQTMSPQAFASGARSRSQCYSFAERAEVFVLLLLQPPRRDVR